MNKSEKQLIVVLGMHRSGTSAITRGLSAIGVDLGSRLVPGIAGDNEKGFFEDTDVNAFNNELLHALGHEWHTPAPVTQEELSGSIARTFMPRAVELLCAKLDPTAVFGLKDPRFCRLLPFWQDVFGGLALTASYVIACRNPLSVSRSLHKRNDFDPAKSYYLWLEHMLASITHTAGQSRIVVDYDRLMDDPAGQLQRLADFLKLNLDPASPEFSEYQNGFLDASLRHTRFGAGDPALDRTVPENVVDLYLALQELAADHSRFDSPQMVSLLTRLNGQQKEIRPALAFIRVCEDKLADLGRMVGHRDRQIASLNQVLNERDGQVAAVDRALAERDGQVATLDRALVERDGRIAVLGRALAERDAQCLAIQASLSWRVTSPLRAISTRHPRLRIALRGAVRLVWWIVTFQLLKKYRRRQAELAATPHFSPPANDYALAVPVSCVSTLATSVPSLAVVCHMFFDHMAEEFKSYLSNIPFQFDLYITTDTNEKKRRIESAFAGWKQGRVEIRIAQNRGRDIAPKLITCLDVYGRYEYVLHIHTKDSPYGGHVAGWRKYLLETLLGSREIVASIFEVFQNHPGIGMIAPQHLEGVRPGIGWGLNYRNARTFSRRLALNLDINQIIDFPSGSMFWARSAALKPILNIGLSFDDFPVEKGQEDGTLAHLIERLYFHICEAAGFDWIKIAQPGLLHYTRHRVIDVKTAEELANFYLTHRVRLLTKRHAARFSRKSTGDSAAGTVISSRQSQLLRLAHSNSDYRVLDFPEFVDEVTNLAAGKSSAIDFDESFYLEANPDVREAVRDGVFPSGYIHYCVAGKSEGRIWSNGEITKRFGIGPALGRGMFTPVNARPLPKCGPDLSDLPESSKPFLLVLFWNLEKDLFYAGYAEFFHDFEPVFKLFSRIVISVESPNFDSRLATQFSSSIEVIHASELPQLSQRPSVIVAFNHQLFHKASDMFNDRDNTVYYCQEFEAGFFPFGAEYVLAERAVSNSRNLIISTNLLRRYFDSRRLLADAANIVVTAPTIESIDVREEKSRKLFFYFRPEPFHSRNLPQVILSAVSSFCEKHTGYEIYMVGTVATSYSFANNGNVVFVLSKLQKEDYVRIVSSCDVAVSLIYSAHPGVVAFQTAASGIPTVTNVFDNRSASLLREISENFIPYDPVRDDLVALIETGLAMPKGRRSFNSHLYGGRCETDLDSYFLEILEPARKGEPS